jgi:hypothetical protein
MATGAASYPLLAGVSRRTFHQNLVPYAIGSDPSMETFPLCRQQQIYKFFKSAADITFNIATAGEAVTGGLARQPVRVRVLDGTGAAVQVFEGMVVTGVNTPNPSTITLPPGTYTLEVNDNGINFSGTRIEWPRTHPIVFETITVNEGFDQARNVWFYVPKDTTRISLAFGSYDNIVQFYQPDGSTTQSTISEGMFGWYCEVPEGLDGQPWAFRHIQTIGNHPPRLENCPNYFAFHKDQLMVPAGLDGL